MRIREELLLSQAQDKSPAGMTAAANANAVDRTSERLAALASKFDVAFGKYASISREEDANLKPAFSAMEIFLQQLKSHGACGGVNQLRFDAI